MGILMGNLLAADPMGPALGGLITPFALLGGSFGQLFTSGILHKIIELLPSYWIVHAATSALRGAGWPAEGWAVIAAWTVGLAVLAWRAYQRDPARV
jgi:ABC-2 type transport system permease protein